MRYQNLGEFVPGFPSKIPIAEREAKKKRTDEIMQHADIAERESTERQRAKQYRRVDIVLGTITLKLSTPIR